VYLTKNMNTESYLKRINYQKPLKADKETLFQLHQAHLYHVPFEDLNIHYDIPIVLRAQDLYEKVVTNRRGGFCYELNGLFGELLKEIGFQTTLVAAKVIDKHGKVGPKYDHAALIVELENLPNGSQEKWLVDVGFGGDSFVLPKELKLDIVQKDIHDYYKFEKYGEQEWLLLQSGDGQQFTKQYVFSFESEELTNFEGECQKKQTEEEGYFKKNLMCTKATPEGRISIFNDRLTIKDRSGKEFRKIENEKELFSLLATEFGIPTKDLVDNQIKRK